MCWKIILILLILLLLLGILFPSQKKGMYEVVKSFFPSKISVL